MLKKKTIANDIVRKKKQTNHPFWVLWRARFALQWKIPASCINFATVIVIVLTENSSMFIWLSFFFATTYAFDRFSTSYPSSRCAGNRLAIIVLHRYAHISHVHKTCVLTNMYLCVIYITFGKRFCDTRSPCRLVVTHIPAHDNDNNSNIKTIMTRCEEKQQNKNEMPFVYKPALKIAPITVRIQWTWRRAPVLSSTSSQRRLILIFHGFPRTMGKHSRFVMWRQGSDNNNM